MPAEDFDTFFTPQFPRVVAFLVRYGYPFALAEDCAAEAMYLLQERWDQVERPGAWVRKVAANMAMRAAMRDAQGTQRAAKAGWADRPAAVDPTLDVEARLRRADLLRRLPDRQRQVMAWTMDGFTPAEIADILGLPPDTVRSNLRAAREKLKQQWRQMERNEGGA